MIIIKYPPTNPYSRPEHEPQRSKPFRRGVPGCTRSAGGKMSTKEGNRKGEVAGCGSGDHADACVMYASIVPASGSSVRQIGMWMSKAGAKRLGEGAMFW